MKFLAVLALCVVAVYARSGTTILEKGPECPLNETTIAPGREFNLTLLPIITIEPGAVRSDIVINGLQTLSYEYNITLITTTIEFDINLPTVNLVCDDYRNVVGMMDATPLRPETLPSGNFVGQGAASLSATGVHVRAKAVLLVNLITDRLSCRELTVEDLKFDTLAASLGAEFLLEGSPIDWAAWSSTFKANFEQDWAAFQPEIVDKVRLAANNLLQELTLEELIELIGGGEPGGGEC